MAAWNLIQAATGARAAYLCSAASNCIQPALTRYATVGWRLLLMHLHLASRGALLLLLRC